jgi:DNA gyrase subunit B
MKQYTAADIKVLPWQEHLRKRPAMYVGSVDAAGIFHLFKEIVDSMVAGSCTQVITILEEDGSITIDDNGPGLPVEKHPKLNKSILEMIFTTLPCGSRECFDKAVVCGLSEWLEVNTSSEDEIGWINTYEMRFSKGHAVSKLEPCSYYPRTGTSITFFPDPEIFGEATLDVDAVRDYIKELRLQHPKLRFPLIIDAPK